MQDKNNNDNHSINLDQTKIDKPPWILKYPKIDLSLTSAIRKSDSELKCKSLAMDMITRYAGRVQVYTDGFQMKQGM